jgi:hypothetical protein
MAKATEPPEAVYDVTLEQWSCPEPGEPGRFVFTVKATFVKRAGETEIPFMEPISFGYRRQKPEGIAKIQEILGRNLLAAKKAGVPRMSWLTLLAAKGWNRPVCLDGLTYDEFIVLEKVIARMVSELIGLGVERAKEKGIKIPKAEAMK